MVAHEQPSTIIINGPTQICIFTHFFMQMNRINILKPFVFVVGFFINKIQQQ